MQKLLKCLYRDFETLNQARLVFFESPKREPEKPVAAETKEKTAEEIPETPEKIKAKLEKDYLSDEMLQRFVDKDTPEEARQAFIAQRPGEISKVLDSMFIGSLGVAPIYQALPPEQLYKTFKTKLDHALLELAEKLEIDMEARYQKLGDSAQEGVAISERERELRDRDLRRAQGEIIQEEETDPDVIEVVPVATAEELDQLERVRAEHRRTTGNSVDELLGPRVEDKPGKGLSVAELLAAPQPVKVSGEELDALTLSQEARADMQRGKPEQIRAERIAALRGLIERVGTPGTEAYNPIERDRAQEELASIESEVHDDALDYLSPAEKKRWRDVQKGFEAKYKADLQILVHPGLKIRDIVHRNVISLGLKVRGVQDLRPEEGTVAIKEEAVEEALLQRYPELQAFDDQQQEAAEGKKQGRILLYSSQDDKFYLVGGGDNIRVTFRRGATPAEDVILGVKGEQVLAQADRGGEVIPGHLAATVAHREEARAEHLRPQEPKVRDEKPDTQAPLYHFEGEVVHFQPGKESKVTLGKIAKERKLPAKLVISHQGNGPIVAVKGKGGEYFEAQTRKPIQLAEGDRIETYTGTESGNEILNAELEGKNLDYDILSDGTVLFGSREARNKVTLGLIKKVQPRFPNQVTVEHQGQEKTGYYNAETGEYYVEQGVKDPKKRLKVYENDKIIGYNKDTMGPFLA